MLLSLFVWILLPFLHLFVCLFSHVIWGPVLSNAGSSKGAFFWDYSVSSYPGITTYRISIPKKNRLWYFENRIGWHDKKWCDETKEVRVRRFFCQETGENNQKNMITDYIVYSIQTAVPSIPLTLLSGAELTEYYSIHSRIKIGPPKRQSIPCILIPE